jgi:hypothetical protein
MKRIVIVGGPRCGKSQLSKALRARGYPTFCGDPHDKVKEPEPGVTYLAEGMGMDSASSRYIVDHWLPMPGPWVLEGHIMARVLRKWLDDNGVQPAYNVADEWPCDRIVVFPEQHPDAEITSKQVALHKGVIGKTWREIEDYFEGMVEVIRHSDPWLAGATPDELADVTLGLRRR